MDLAVVGGTIPPQFNDQLEVSPFATDEFVLVRANPQFSHLEIDLEDTPTLLKKSDLYDLRFISLNPQSSTKKAIDTTLEAYGINPSKFQVEMELTSLEAIKNAVKAGTRGRVSLENSRSRRSQGGGTTAIASGGGGGEADPTPHLLSQSLSVPSGS